MLSVFFFLSEYSMSQGLNTTLRNNGIESEGNEQINSCSELAVSREVKHHHSRRRVGNTVFFPPSSL